MRSATLLLLVVASSVAVAAATDRQTKTFPWSASRTLSLAVTIGEVRILGMDRTDLEIAVQRTAPTADALARVPIEFDETPERVTARFVQADGNTDAAIRTDVVLRVPMTALIERVDVLEGRLQIERFRGSLTAEVRRGPIEGTDVAGVLRLATSVGSVTLDQARLVPEGLLRLRAFNGDIRLRMPGAPVDARVMALALNGTITSDIPLTTRDSWGPRWSEATLGKGEPVISIDVVSGSVQIRTR